MLAECLNWTIKRKCYPENDSIFIYVLANAPVRIKNVLISILETGGQMLSVSDLIVLTVRISIHWRYRVFYQEHPVFSQICPFSFFICCWLCFDLLFRLFPQDSLDAVSCFQGISTGRRQLYLDVVWLSVVFLRLNSLWTRLACSSSSDSLASWTTQMFFKRFLLFFLI